MNNILGGKLWPPPACPSPASSCSRLTQGLAPRELQDGWVGGRRGLVYEHPGIYSLFVYSSSLFARVFVSRNYPESDLQDGVKLARSLFSFSAGPL